MVADELRAAGHVTHALECDVVVNGVPQTGDVSRHAAARRSSQGRQPQECPVKAICDERGNFPRKLFSFCAKGEVYTLMSPNELNVKEIKILKVSKKNTPIREV